MNDPSNAPTPAPENGDPDDYVMTPSEQKVADAFENLIRKSIDIGKEMAKADLDTVVNYPGTKVLLGNHGDTFPGEITRIQISPGPRIMYEVEWWDGKDRKSHWFNPLEITLVTDPIPVKIGFAQ